jgi:hypothetical protein
MSTTPVGHGSVPNSFDVEAQEYSTYQNGNVQGEFLEYMMIIGADVYVELLSYHRSPTANFLAQGVHGRGGVLRVGSDMVVQCPSGLGGVKILILAVVLILVLVLDSLGGMLQESISMTATLAMGDDWCYCNSLCF